MVVKFKRLVDNAIMPIRGTVGSAGIDLTAIQITTETNEVGEVILVYHTGLSVEIPEGYCGLLFMRSSVSKKAISMCNAVGVIDSDYRGEITGKFRTTTNVVPSVYQNGERFAQLVIVPLLNYTIEEAETLGTTERGEGSYGSTDNMQSSAATPLQQPESVIARDTKDDVQSAEAVVSASEQAAEPINGSEGV